MLRMNRRFAAIMSLPFPWLLLCVWCLAGLFARAQDAAPADRNAVNTRVRPGDMMADSPVTFPKEGALPAKCSPDVRVQDGPAEKDYYIFGSPCRSLAQIAAIRAAMPKGQFTPPGLDSGPLQRTRRILNEGGDLRLFMTTPWAEYIRSAQVHPHFFYRDVVHANEFGEQILSKIVMAFWTAPVAQTPPLPVRKLMDTPLRDPSICLGPDGQYYLTGTVEPFWGFNEGIELWRSPDLTNWTGLGFVWKYGASPWHQKYLQAKKPLCAPEVHYLKGTFWLTYSMPGWDHTAKTSGSGLLRSTTGKPEGPYADVQPAERMGDEIDASLFEDDDGAVYFLWHSGKIARMKADLTGLAEPYHWLKTTSTDPNPNHHSGLCAGIFGKDSFDHVGYEGMFLFKREGRYYLACSENFDGRYSCAISTSTNIYGPYGARYEAIPHGGHNVFFQDKDGRWWSSYFGSDGTAPWQERPGILAITFDATGRLGF